MFPPSHAVDGPVHRVSDATGPVELVREQRDAAQDEHEAWPRNERQAEDDASDQQQDADHEAPEANPVPDHVGRPAECTAELYVRRRTRVNRAAPC